MSKHIGMDEVAALEELIHAVYAQHPLSSARRQQLLAAARRSLLRRPGGRAALALGRALAHASAPAR